MSCNGNMIEISGLSKCFFVYKNPIDRLKQFILPKLFKMIGKDKIYYDEFWAVNDVSLKIKKGETVAIIGRNGSGKSTLLQMICGTLQPTSGSISVNGKVAALLELGSGFNPEFTGRENVYLSGSVYGLSNEEIDAKFDDIQKFADIGDFIEQPVKTYSSGMYVRLAFAVIAHVDADILVIDEALAVGDAVFTQKCMRYIRNFQKTGTLLFVSHDLASVQNLCEKALWLNKGNTVEYGYSKDVAESYLQYTIEQVYGDEVKVESISKDKKIAETSTYEAEDSFYDYNAVYEISDNLNESNGWSTGKAEITDIRFSNLTSDEDVFKGGEKVKLTLTAKAHIDLDAPILGFLLKDKLGQFLFGENSLPLTDESQRSYKKGDSFSCSFVFTLPMLPNGEYSIMCSVANGILENNIQHHHLHDALIINVFDSKVRWGLVGVKFDDISMTKV
ncbi:ABC transporter ATP-binding protein [Vibrio barjaei]|uniref:ABC transporter ATP-binding protein n=1 Tax=Vibrio barjaei TaxID=1676683 RepID=UPI00228534E0|nr:ABC transporter ATP-binding protein [Vibrio barjaei]MCY9872546.1 ABC transporter ATP-binding protein [Vibrio barjaei]